MMALNLSNAPQNFRTHNIGPLTNITPLKPSASVLTSSTQDWNGDRTINLFIPPDSTFRGPVHVFIWCHCIEIFVAMPDDMMVAVAGRWEHPSKLCQVELGRSYCNDVPRQENLQNERLFTTAWVFFTAHASRELSIYSWTNQSQM